MSCQELLEIAVQGPPGPPGPAGGTPPVSPVFTYASGKLVGVVYADGSTKTMTWAGEQLAQVDFARVGYPTTRKTLAYNPNGTLASVTETVI